MVALLLSFTIPAVLGTVAFVGAVEVLKDLPLASARRRGARRGGRR